MPANTGTMTHRIPERVDIKLACGAIVRDRDPKKYRWTLTGSPGDIAEWAAPKSANATASHSGRD